MHKQSIGACAVFSVVMLLTGSGCSGNGNPSSTPSAPSLTADELRAHSHVIDLQHRMAGLFLQVLAIRDTASAIDSILQVLRADTSVQLANAVVQGIAVQYANGICGGLFLFPGDEGGPAPPDTLFRKAPESMVTPGPDPPSTTSVQDIVVPGSKRTAVLNPHYFERQRYTDPVIALYNSAFPRIGFEPPEVYLNDDANLDKFVHLSDHGYGYVHIYSHGWLWRSGSFEERVYLMTGETATAEVSARYRDAIWKDSTIALATGSDGITRYWISHEFVQPRWDFSQDTTLIFGGFCYSALGEWYTLHWTGGAAGYLGYMDPVLTTWSCFWAKSLISCMTDTSIHPPVTLNRWHRATNIPHSYTNAGGNPVDIMAYTLHTDVALWRDARIDLSTVTSMSLSIGGVLLTSLSTCGNPPEPEQWGKTWNGIPGTFNNLSFSTVFHESGFSTSLGTASRDVTFDLTLNARHDSILTYAITEVIRYDSHPCSDTTLISGRGVRFAPPGVGSGMLNFQALRSSVCSSLRLHTSRICIEGGDTCRVLGVEYDCGEGELQVSFFDR
jgi:hypothetical protein